MIPSNNDLEFKDFKLVVYHLNCKDKTICWGLLKVIIFYSNEVFINRRVVQVTK